MSYPYCCVTCCDCGSYTVRPVRYFTYAGGEAESDFAALASVHFPVLVGGVSGKLPEQPQAVAVIVVAAA